MLYKVGKLELSVKRLRRFDLPSADLDHAMIRVGDSGQMITHPDHCVIKICMSNGLTIKLVLEIFRAGAVRTNACQISCHSDKNCMSNERKTCNAKVTDLKRLLL